MNGILILAHGSREKATEETLDEIIASLKKLLPGESIETAYLQFSDKNLAKGLDALKSRSAQHITVIPYFLFSGIHICEDIPAEIQAYCHKNPGVTITMGKTLGADPRLAEILADRIREAV